LTHSQIRAIIVVRKETHMITTLDIKEWLRMRERVVRRLRELDAQNYRFKDTYFTKEELYQIKSLLREPY
jgi:hypothetical protein